MAAEKILLGYGVVTVGTKPIGLTRGGSVFTVEREYRNIEADGDKGSYQKDRILIDKEDAMLKVNALELFTATDMDLYYPAMSITPDSGTTPTKHTMTSTMKIVEGDYNDVKWVGETKDGKAVTIIIENALNLGSLEWALEDKNEVVPELEFTACWEDDENPPWHVDFAV